MTASVSARSSNPHELKAEILRRLANGERGAEIARDLGVTRQYVSSLSKRAASEGCASVISLVRGRPKHRLLTHEEADSLRARLTTPRAEDAAPHDDRWTAAEIKTWFRETHGRTLSIHELRKFCTDHGLQIAPPAGTSAETEDMETAPRPTPRSTPGTRRAPRSASRAEPANTIAEMARINAETARRMGKAREEAAAVAATPVRLGPKLGRNDPCPLDPTKKFKRCCGAMGATRCLKVGGAAGA